MAFLLAGFNLQIDRLLIDLAITNLTGNAPLHKAPDTPPAINAALLEGLLLFIIALISTWAGFKLQQGVRYIVCFQLLVLSGFGLWALWSLAHYAGHPVCFLSTVLGAQLAGILIGIIDRHLRRAESQNYELLLRNRELLETKLQMVKQDEIERRLLAADLHDQVLNDLKSIRNTLAEYFEKPDPKLATTVDELLERSMREIREVMDSLCPFSLEILGLPAALDECLRRGSEKAGFRGKLRNSLKGGELDTLSVVELSLLYRLVQESLTNICKHAAATAVKITLENRDGLLAIMVIDDGKGINIADLSSQSRGLGYMRQRADLIGATVNWKRGEDNRGTVVEILMNLTGRKSDNNSNS